ncbi:MAG: hypothetical protein LLG04_17910 [Parachlamydia sp.]|nr:hypothetical protein [Parachlamydia sp.]
MKFQIILCLLMILCQGCVPKVSKECTAAYCFMGDFAKKQQFENGLSAYGVGLSMPDGKIKKLTLYFVTQRKLEVEESRILYITVTQQMLNQINADEGLRFCLDHYPFTVDDLNISLAFEKETGRDVDPPYIAYVAMTRGIIRYVFYDASTDRFFKEQITEPYEEALRIVRSEGKVAGLNLSCRQ